MPTSSPRHNRLALFIVGLGWILFACNLSGGTPPTPVVMVVPTEPPTRSAQLSELQSDVQARGTESDVWDAAFIGKQLAVGGGAKTGSESRARLDVSDGTIVRLGAFTEFQLINFSPEPTDPITRLRLEAGKVWVAVTSLLGGGSFEIETPTSVSTVRGSMMSVAYDPVTGQTIITCLEGACRLTGASGAFTDLTAGQQTEISGFGLDPVPAFPITQNELAEWSQEAPEAQSAVAIVTQQLATQATDITSEGTADASSIFSADFPASLAVDGTRGTSWFSAGPNVDTPYSWFRWIGTRDDLIASIEILSNGQHDDATLWQNFGFASVTVQVLDANNTPVYEQSYALDGTPDPDVIVAPNVMGRSVVLYFYGHEDATCGGFAELKIFAVR